MSVASTEELQFVSEQFNQITNTMDLLTSASFKRLQGREAEGRQKDRKKRKKERKVSDNGTVCNVYQIYYEPVFLLLNTELNSRDSYNRNLIQKVVEYQSSLAYTRSRSQPYEIALFDVACNSKHTEGQIIQA